MREGRRAMPSALSPLASSKIEEQHMQLQPTTTALNLNVSMPRLITRINHQHGKKHGNTQHHAGREYKHWKNWTTKKETATEPLSI
jgi:hypothetical protein